MNGSSSEEQGEILFAFLEPSWRGGFAVSTIVANFSSMSFRMTMDPIILRMA